MKKSVTCTTAFVLTTVSSKTSPVDALSSESGSQARTLVLIDPVILDLDEDIPVQDIKLRKTKHMV